MAFFGFTTANAEALVQEAVRELRDGVSKDRLTRRQAMRLLADAIAGAMEMTGVAYIDGETLDAVAAELSPVFQEAGYKPPLAVELQSAEHEVDIVSQTSLELVNEALKAVTDTWSLTLKTVKLRCLAGDVPPWGTEWLLASPDCDLYLFLAPAPVSGNPRVNALVISERSEFCFLSDVLESETLWLAVLAGVDVGHDGRVLLGTLALAMSHANLTLCAVNDPDRVVVTMTEAGVLSAAYRT